MALNIADFEIKGIVQENAYTTIFHALRLSDKKDVILKVLKAEYTNDTYNQRIQNEFQILEKLDSPHIIKAYSRIPIEMTYFLVLEYFPSTSLAEFIEKEPWDLNSHLKIAIQLAEGLCAIHQKNIIHKDIKPQNILINSNKEIKIIDFGIATSLSREMLSLNEMDRLEGSASYISPEQSARINRPIDYRSDIYSLGVTLYQLFTGALPFVANTLMELIHLHIAQRPVAPQDINPKIPKTLSNIILKCLEKDAENRYKSVLGLKRDLERCLQELSLNGVITDFRPGEHDLYDRYHTPTKIFGREEELALIHRCAEDVAVGKLRILAIRGYSGVGKSSIVYESQHSFSLKQVRYASTKFDQFKLNVPYFAITQVISALINQILTESKEHLASWKKRFLEAVGQEGQLLIEFVPEIKFIIGEQPPLETLDPLQSENRYKTVLINFFKALLIPERPLVLLFDDFQWTDNASLKLLKNLLMEKGLGYLFVILVYRDNEISATHPLQIALNELSEQSVEVISLPISPLKLQYVEQIILHIFTDLSDDDTKELGLIVENKTKGNPFFVIQFLKFLYEKGLIQFENSSSKWIVDLKKIKGLEISDNVVDFLIQKIKTLDDEVIEYMKICAAVGNTFDPDLVGAIESGLPANRIIHKALEEEFIVQEIDAASQKTTYKFAHDRIQQAFYNLINSENLSSVHYKIGRTMKEIYSSSNLEEQLVTIVNHLNFQLRADISEEEKKELLNLNIAVGRRIQEAQAPSAAIAYYENALFLMGENPWEKDYATTFSLYKNLALCRQLSGETEDAEKTYRHCIQNAQTVDEKVSLYPNLIYLLDQMHKYQEVFVCGDEAFKLLDYPFDMNPSFLSFLFLLIRTRLKLKFYTTKQLENLPLATDKRIISLCRFFASMGHAAYKSNIFLCGKLILSGINLALKHGVTMSTSESFGGFALLLSSYQVQDLENSYKFGLLARHTARRFPLCQEGASASCIFSLFCNHLKTPFRNCIPPSWEAYHECLTIGAIGSAGACLMGISLYRILAGDPLQTVFAETDELINESRKITARSEEKTLCIYKEFCKALLKINPDSTKCCPPEIADEVPATGVQVDQIYIAHYYAWNGMLLYLDDQFEKVKTQTKELLVFSDRFQSMPEWNITHLYYCLSITALMQSPSDNKEDWKTIQKSFKWLELLAKGAPSNYRPYMLLVQGEMSRLENKHEEAVKCFDEAIELALEANNLLITGIAYEVMARYYIRQNAKQSSAYFMHQALSSYKLLGAESKCEQLKKKYVAFLAIKKTSSSESIKKHVTDSDDFSKHVTASMATIVDDKQLDLNSVIEFSQALSGEIQFEKLMESLMHILVVNAGATKAFLIMYEDEKPFVYSEMFISKKFTSLSHHIPLDDRKDDLCRAIVDYAERTKSEVVINDATLPGTFSDTDYFKMKNPKSILCIPLIQKGELKGILYLENNETIGAFAPRHQHLLLLLSTQIAISIENAQFYALMEGKVISRTKELQVKNEQLEEALLHIKEVQEQLAQREKLASLGLLTAGIAHELKNPLNFVINFTKLAKTHFADLQKEFDSGNKQERDLIVTEINDSLDAVETHGVRANTIIKGMLSHASKGEKKKEPIHLNDLVEQAFNIAYYNFSQKNAAFKSVVKMSYDAEIPVFEGIPSDLTSVIINIIDNACYALFQRQKSGEEFSPLLEIITQAEGTQAKIIIRDNGIGIPSEILDKVFNPFFTTKAAGVGTGLGLSVSYDVIVNKHQGSIKATSEPGIATEFVVTLPSKLVSVS